MESHIVQNNDRCVLSRKKRTGQCHVALTTLVVVVDIAVTILFFLHERNLPCLTCNKNCKRIRSNFMYLKITTETFTELGML